MKNTPLLCLSLLACALFPLSSLASCAYAPVTVSPGDAAPSLSVPSSALPENDPPMPGITPPGAQEEPPMPEVTPPTSQEVPPMPEVTPPVMQEKPPMSEMKYIKVLCDNLNVRAMPGTNGKIYGQVNKGDYLLMTGEESGFYKTVYRGKPAYVSASKKYTAIGAGEKSEEKIERVIEEGCRLIGTPYVYGAVRYHDGTGRKLSGFTTDKFDCSSLMQYIFYLGGDEILQVNTRTQIFQGEKVKKSDIKRGDLLFFTNASRSGNSGIERIGHVGLYLGDNLILHTASDYCKIEQINATRWGYYEQARRIIR